MYTVQYCHSTDFFLPLLNDGTIPFHIDAVGMNLVLLMSTEEVHDSKTPK